MYCSNCGKEGNGKYCAECGGLLVEGEQETQEKKQYIEPPRKPLETDISEYVNGHSINMTEIMKHYEKNKEYGIEVLAYYSDISLQEAERYINNKLNKDKKTKRSFFRSLKIRFLGSKKENSEKPVVNSLFNFHQPKPRVKTDFLEIDDKNNVTFRGFDMMFKGTLVKKSNNSKYVIAFGSYGKKVKVECYVFFNRERPLHKLFITVPFKEAYVTNTGAFSLLTSEGHFYLYDVAQKEPFLTEIKEEEIQIITHYFCEPLVILLYKKEGKYFLFIYNTQKGNTIYKKYFDMDSEQILKSTIKVENSIISLEFPCGLSLRYDFRGNAVDMQDEKNTLNRLYYPVAYINNAIDKIELLRQDNALLETRMREIRALFELAIEKVGDMYWCYDNYACFEAEFGDIALAKKYLTKAENSQNSRNADLYKVCANFALKREMKDYALEFFEKAIHFKVDNKTIESYNTLKQELEEEAKKKQSKKRTLFKKETEENKEENKEKEKTEKEIIPEKKEEPKKNTKKKSPSPMEAFLPDDVLEEMNAEEQQQESIPISEEPKEEESDFEKRRKAREEMRSRHRRRRTENTEE